MCIILAIVIKINTHTIIIHTEYNKTEDLTESALINACFLKSLLQGRFSIFNLQKVENVQYEWVR